MEIVGGGWVGRDVSSEVKIVWSLYYPLAASPPSCWTLQKAQYCEKAFLHQIELLALHWKSKKLCFRPTFFFLFFSLFIFISFVAVVVVDAAHLKMEEELLSFSHSGEDFILRILEWNLILKPLSASLALRCGMLFSSPLCLYRECMKHFSGIWFFFRCRISNSTHFLF